MIAPRRGVNLTDLLASQSGDELTPHHLPSHPQAVREVLIITNVDDVLGVGPDSVVLLGEELALGGWVVSVAPIAADGTAGGGGRRSAGAS